MIPDVFLKMTVLINFNNWGLYYFVIVMQSKNDGHLKKEERPSQIAFNRQIRGLNLFTLLMSLVLLTITSLRF